MTRPSHPFASSTFKTPRTSWSASSSYRSASSRWLSLAFLVVLAALLVGYMFLGRGFAHLGVGPIFVGDAVLLLGLAVTGFVVIRERMRPSLSWLVGFIVAFAVLGALRTLPYLGTYGLDALRDGVLWGYAGFALSVYVLLERASLLTGFRAYGWIVPVFALWLPICWNIFSIASLEIDPNRPGGVVPLVFFKAGDMAVHVVGAVAFLVLGTTPVRSVRTVVWRAVVCLPLLWTVFVAGTSNRGALLTSVVGIAAVVVVAPRARNWLPILASVAVFVIALVLQGVLAGFAGGAPAVSESAPAIGSATPGISSGTPVATRSPAPTPTARPMPSSTDADGVKTPSPSATAGVGVTVSNGGFEDPPGADGQIDGWSARAAEMALVKDGGAHRGATFASMSNPLGPYEATLTSNRFSFDGPDLEVSAWVKSVRGNPALEIYVNWYSRSGRLISSDFVSSLGTEGSRNWQRCSGRVTAPEGAESAAILLYEAAGGATVGVDEIAVRSGDLIPDSAPGTSEFVNGDFEDGLADAGMIDGWTPSGPGVTTREGTAHSGDQFASIENRNGPYQATLTSTVFAFDEGQDIQVSLWVSAIEARPKLEIYINWYDDSGQQISSVFMNSLIPDGEATWRECVGFLPSPPGATRAQILLYEANGEATMGIDDVRVKVGDFIPQPGPAARPGGRPATIGQMIDNIFSLFGSSADGGLEGTKQFRLAWWGTIVDYTVFGDYFWTGKGFGVNLADDDGFQSTSDGSLRAPHNSHLTVLARMGVPGLILWLLIMGAFAVGMVRATLALRRSGDGRLAAVSAWILVYWFAMMVDTSFDPYLEGPQGGIWFWSVFGLGLVVMRISNRDRNA